VGNIWVDKFMNDNHDPDLLDVVEGLLNFCCEREQEIARLVQQISDLIAVQEDPNSGENDPDSLLPEVLQENLRVMVVDDSEIMQARLSDLLLSNGYNVIGVASNGYEAIQLFMEKRPPIVTMDIDMPVMDGFEATRCIKKIDPSTKIVIISQIMNRSMILNAISAGATEFLVKPVQIDRFLQVVGRLAGRGASKGDVRSK
jgi:two-component system, chemotaxis family, chemotaxis protein CheY